MAIVCHLPERDLSAILWSLGILPHVFTFIRKPWIYGRLFYVVQNDEFMAFKKRRAHQTHAFWVSTCRVVVVVVYFNI